MTSSHRVAEVSSQVVERVQVMLAPGAGGGSLPTAAPLHHRQRLLVARSARLSPKARTRIDTSPGVGSGIARSTPRSASKSSTSRKLRQYL